VVCVATVTLEHVSKIYRGGVEAVHDLDLEVGDGEFLVLVGPSGCGKTTALRMVAGLEDVTSGNIRVGERDITDIPSQDRDIAMVFQNYALYPHMTVAENIGFPLRLRRVAKQEIKQRVDETAQILGLSEQLDRKPGQLSGGQRQRVAMGRAIIREPAVFLMDEPLSNLDAKLRVQMRSEIARIQRRLEVSTLYVTHDQTEAMTMGDRVAVMRRGELQQVDAPQVLYRKPANLFVGAFIGSPSMNLYEGTVSDSEDEILLGHQHIAIPRSLAGSASVAARRGQRVVVGIRPEHLAESADNDRGQQLQAEVELVEELGAEKLVHFTLDAKRVHVGDATVAVVEGGAESELASGEIGSATMDEGVARFGPMSAVRAGEKVTLTIDPDWLYLFDEASGESLVNGVGPKTPL
jgi:multiple sugar transport system ATP-binding protein